jgi:hypothetical protein
MMNDIIKREIIDSEESKKAKKDIEKIYKKLERVKEKNSAVSHDSDSSKPEESPIQQDDAETDSVTSE